MVEQPVAGSIRPSEISESPPPVPRSGRMGGLPRIESVPSGLVTTSTRQKMLPFPVGADRYAAAMLLWPAMGVLMLGSAPPPASASGGVHGGRVTLRLFVCVSSVLHVELLSASMTSVPTPYRVFLAASPPESPP